MNELFLFSTALVAIYLAPGPDMILVLGTTVRDGQRQAIATAAGLAVARSIHVLLAAVGLAALFDSQPWSYHTVRLLGAAYLLYLGWQFLRNSGALPEQSALAAGNKRRGYLAAFRRGLATNLLNPKSLIFCSVLLPQFIHPELSGVAEQFAVLAVILVLTGFAFDLAFAFLGRGLWALTAGNARYQKVQNNVFALLMMGIGLKVALS
ncbi:LysE family translocator [Marinobacter sp. HL-58]|uniref:LysE family translocator n=1 Tax=Marinobacter sp. HL-58 TaxID=1479237 RepID=UPI0004867522|nr:LysE family translocator [Marinobacter sp. HL-58]KPP97650.1 MAG: putative threonine efflux protein [Marinobacter sp. HL-58]